MRREKPWASGIARLEPTDPKLSASTHSDHVADMCLLDLIGVYVMKIKGKAQALLLSNKTFG